MLPTPAPSLFLFMLFMCSLLRLTHTYYIHTNMFVCKFALASFLFCFVVRLCNARSVCLRVCVCWCLLVNVVLAVNGKLNVANAALLRAERRECGRSKESRAPRELHLLAANLNSLGAAKYATAPKESQIGRMLKAKWKIYFISV